MSTVLEIEQAIRSLGEDELTKLRAWFDEFVADAWDRKIEADAEAGKLDALADEALTDLRAGRCTDL